MTAHHCNLTDLDYDDVEAGLIRCTVCPRVWQLVVRIGKDGKRWSTWTASPCPGCETTPCRCSGRRASGASRPQRPTRPRRSLDGW